MFDVPLPVSNEDSEAYWEACNKHKLLMSQCQDCQHNWLPHMGICPKCLSDNVKDVEASGKATVVSRIVVYKSQHPAFSGRSFNVAIVELDEGPRMHTRIEGVEDNKFSIGDKMEVEYLLPAEDEAGEKVTLPVFKPLGSDWKPSAE